MTEQCRTVTIGGKRCHIYYQEGIHDRFPVFYWGIAQRDTDTVMTVVSYVEKQTENTSFLLVAYEVESWNDAFSPWEAPAVFGKENFGGNAGETLKWLREYCIPFVVSKNFAENLLHFPVGYSLAGLFSLWAFFEDKLFDGAISCSGSLWFSGWEAYVEQHCSELDRVKTNYIYLSLGDKEEKTKNKQMASVGDNTRNVYALLCQKPGAVRCVLEWNKGGHFSEPEVRVAKGINWVMTFVT